MTELMRMRQWLLTYPRWDAGGLLFIDYTDGVPGGSGLFPTGYQELGRRTDVLGNRRIDGALHFALYRIVRTPEDQEANAQWLMEFQQWVRKESAEGRAPHFGDDPAREQLRAEQGRYLRRADAQSGIYAVEITAEFTKYYEVKENGEN